MTTHAFISVVPGGSLSALHTKLVEFANHVGEARTPADVLDALHAVSTTTLPLNVLGVARFPLKVAGMEAVQLGKSAFLHQSVPAGWWEEYTVLAKTHFTPGIFLARSSLASFTWTETNRWFEPIGADRWSHELALKYGMRDGLTYGVGGRWVIAFWSRKDLSNILTPPARIIVCAASSFAALRLEQLAGIDADRIRTSPRLTARELAVLRLVSIGQQSADIAQALGLGEETIRSHLKKAQAKLGVHNRTHAACDAVRQNLIP
jgi:DNA-binding CsgD family transcriptional regulator